jgi:hypothetical protein
MLKRLIPAAALAVALTAGTAPARPIENWEYERLFKEADLVVIARAESTADDDSRLKTGWDAKFLGRVTTFKVQSALKGKADGALKVLHYKLEDGVSIINGPLLVAFRSKARRIAGKGKAVMEAAPEYLLFLKRGKDGRYEPVSGQIDPALSVREIHRPAHTEE